MKNKVHAIGLTAVLAGSLLGFAGSATAQMDPDRGDGFDFDRAGPGYGGHYTESMRNDRSGSGGNSGRSSSQTIYSRTIDQRRTAGVRYRDLKDELGINHPDLRRAATLMNRGERLRDQARTARRFSENDRADSYERSAVQNYRAANEIMEGLYRR